jgi:hypothetical protein
MQLQKRSTLEHKRARIPQFIGLPISLTSISTVVKRTKTVYYVYLQSREFEHSCEIEAGDILLGTSLENEVGFQG